MARMSSVESSSIAARPIAYSLGNFLTYRGFNLDGPLGITGVLQLEFGPIAVSLRPDSCRCGSIPVTGPRPISRARRWTWYGRLSTEDFGPTAARIATDGTSTAPRELAPLGDRPTDSR